jgi:hypothetical protein
LQLLQLLLCLFGDLGGKAVSAVVLLQVFTLQTLALGMDSFQLAFTLAAGGVGLLPD